MNRYSEEAEKEKQRLIEKKKRDAKAVQSFKDKHSETTKRFQAIPEDKESFAAPGGHVSARGEYISHNENETAKDTAAPRVEIKPVIFNRQDTEQKIIDRLDRYFQDTQPDVPFSDLLNQFTDMQLKEIPNGGFWDQAGAVNDTKGIENKEAYLIKYLRTVNPDFKPTLNKKITIEKNTGGFNVSLARTNTPCIDNTINYGSSIQQKNTVTAELFSKFVDEDNKLNLNFASNYPLETYNINYRTDRAFFNIRKWKEPKLEKPCIVYMRSVEALPTQRDILFNTLCFNQFYNDPNSERKVELSTYEMSSKEESPFMCINTKKELQAICDRLLAPYTSLYNIAVNNQGQRIPEYLGKRFLDHVEIYPETAQTGTLFKSHVILTTDSVKAIQEGNFHQIPQRHALQLKGANEWNLYLYVFNKCCIQKYHHWQENLFTVATKENIAGNKKQILRIFRDVFHKFTQDMRIIKSFEYNRKNEIFTIELNTKEPKLLR